MSLTASNSLARKHRPEASAFKRWLMVGYVKEIEGPFEREKEVYRHHWWKVMCLTGVDYFWAVDLFSKEPLRISNFRLSAPRRLSGNLPKRVWVDSYLLAE